MGSTVVEHLTHKPKIEGLHPERERKRERERDREREYLKRNNIKYF